MSGNECRAALRLSVVAMAIAILAMLYATWYLPGLVVALNTLSERLERISNSTEWGNLK